MITRLVLLLLYIFLFDNLIFMNTLNEKIFTSNSAFEYVIFYDRKLLYNNI